MDDDGRFTLTSKNHYSGPAAVTLDVMDGSSQTDDGVLVATVTIPVQVGAPTPVLRCPPTLKPSSKAVRSRPSTSPRCATCGAPIPAR